MRGRLTSLLRTPAATAVAAILIAAPVLAGTDATYAALRAAAPDGRTVPVSGLVLERDAFRFQLDSGTLHFLAPVEGRTVGAVFVGQGSYRLSPSTPAERRQLALVSGGARDFEVLSDRFDRLVLLFTDGTADEIAKHAEARAGAPDRQAIAAWLKHMDRQRKDFRTNFHLRLLDDLLNRPATPGTPGGVFLAFVDGERHPPALAAVDPAGAEALRLATLAGGEEVAFYVADEHKGGFWYLSDLGADAGRRSPARRVADALDYRVETRVARDADVAGTATVRLEVLAPGLRLLPVHLLPRLRLAEASFAPAPAAGAEPAWEPLPFVQEGEKEDADAAVVFPRPLDAGAEVLVRFVYGGDQVLQNVGEKNYVVGARESWYPNLGVFADPATFELVYSVPAGNDIVSVGRLVESKTEGKQAVSVWRTDHPVQVAGFNYGRFKKLEREDEVSKVKVAVYTNPGTPDIIREINDILEAGGGDEQGMRMSLGNVDTGRLAESALVDGMNAARVFTAYFGPLPQSQVAITQQSQWSFGQSWPSLIFMPYLAFLTGTQREMLGISGASLLVEQVGYHEFAHQWWGHLVGWDCYRDQWLSEGFAEFSAALAVQHARGWEDYAKFWRDARKSILSKTPGNAVPPHEAGPITQGWRLSTAKSPSAYGALVYSKGAYVLHMLRMMMWETGSQNPDARFIAMMQDFTKTYAGKSPSTEDFETVVERHMTPALNLRGDGSMDWFFDQWVDGTEIPKITSDLKVAAAGDGYKITGTVKQEGVSDGFATLVPLYVDFGKGEQARLGAVKLVGSSSFPMDVTVKLPKKPKRIVPNAMGDVLARE